MTIKEYVLSHSPRVDSGEPWPRGAVQRWRLLDGREVVIIGVFFRDEDAYCESVPGYDNRLEVYRSMATDEIVGVKVWGDDA